MLPKPTSEERVLELAPPEKVIAGFLDALFGNRESRRISRRMNPKALRLVRSKEAALTI
jgi:hypothetical protein